MIYSFLVGELSGHYIVCPHLTLAHDSLDSIIHTLRRIFVFFQQPFDKTALGRLLAALSELPDKDLNQVLNENAMGISDLPYTPDQLPYANAPPPVLLLL